MISLFFFHDYFKCLKSIYLFFSLSLSLARPLSCLDWNCEPYLVINESEKKFHMFTFTFYKLDPSKFLLTCSSVCFRLYFK